MRGNTDDNNIMKEIKLEIKEEKKKGNDQLGQRILISNFFSEWHIMFHKIPHTRQENHYSK